MLGYAGIFSRRATMTTHRALAGVHTVMGGRLRVREGDGQCHVGRVPAREGPDARSRFWRNPRPAAAAMGSRLSQDSARGRIPLSSPSKDGTESDIAQTHATFAGGHRLGGEGALWRQSWCPGGTGPLVHTSRPARPLRAPTWAENSKMRRRHGEETFPTRAFASNVRLAGNG
jgi:hypothetical protein